MQFTHSLRKNRDFQAVYKKGRSFANKYLIIYILENDQDQNLLGISVSKKVGNSVVRHRVKRIAKESYRLHENMLNSGFNIAVIARPMAKDADFKKIEGAMLSLLKRHHVLKKIDKDDVIS